MVIETLLGAAISLFFIGGAIGNLISGIMNNKTQSSGSTSETSDREKEKKVRAEFTVSLIVLFAAVIKADRITKRSEVLFVKEYLIKTFGTENASEMMQLLKGLLEKEIDLEQVCAQIRYRTSYPMKVELIHLLFLLATADHELLDEEVKTIERISALLGVYPIDFHRILAMFAEENKKDELQNAYDVLGIPKNSTKEEVKSAFRTLSKKFHPDRVTHLGPEYVKVANEKFIKVKEAYDIIMEKAA